MKKNKAVRFKETVGIDIGTHSVKIVHLKRLHNGFKLLNYEVRPTVPHGVEYVLSDLRPERNAPVIVEMLKTLRISPKKIKHLVTSIDPAAFITIAEISDVMGTSVKQK